MIKVYLAEDQAMLNSALTSLLQLEEQIEVIGSAMDGESALQDILRLKPDVAILDIEMPKRTGLEVAEEIQSLDRSEERRVGKEGGRRETQRARGEKEETREASIE